MSRLTRRPPGYDPGLEVYLRRAPEGGEVRMPGELRGGGALLPRERCVLLVHGYNNHDGEAAAAYLGFRGRQYAQFADLIPPQLEGRFADTYWPGDADWWGPLDLADFLFYPFAVRTARERAPQALAQAIERIPNLVELDIVAHSLGCRVVLETLELLRDRAAAPAVRRVCLMAAAVPAEYVGEHGRFAPLLRALQAGGTDIRVLHSRGDWLVLGTAFILGQPLAGEPSLRALGYEGPPHDMPGRGANVSDARIRGAGHGDYWGHSSDKAAAQASADAGRFLKLGGVMREIDARLVSEERPVGFPREI